MHPLFTSRIRSVVLALALVMLASPGCFWSGELAGVRHDFEAQMPGASFNKNIELSFGPLMLSAARLVTGLVPGAREARAWMRGLSRVQVGVYDVDVDSMPDLQMPRRLQSLLDDGWETAVRVRDHNEAVWLLYRPDGDRVREIFVVVLTEDELVLVKAKGKLEKLVAAALSEAHGRPGFLREFDG
jgi:hypothetical protein